MEALRALNLWEIFSIFVFNEFSFDVEQNFTSKPRHIFSTSKSFSWDMIRNCCKESAFPDQPVVDNIAFH